MQKFIQSSQHTLLVPSMYLRIITLIENQSSYKIIDATKEKRE